MNNLLVTPESHRCKNAFLCSKKSEDDEGHIDNLRLVYETFLDKILKILLCEHRGDYTHTYCNAFSHDDSSSSNSTKNGSYHFPPSCCLNPDPDSYKHDYESINMVMKGAYTDGIYFFMNTSVSCKNDDMCMSESLSKTSETTSKIRANFEEYYAKRWNGLQPLIPYKPATKVLSSSLETINQQNHKRLRRKKWTLDRKQINSFRDGGENACDSSTQMTTYSMKRAISTASKTDSTQTKHNNNRKYIIYNGEENAFTSNVGTSSCNIAQVVVGFQRE